MSIQRFPPEFKEEAVRQIVDRGYAVAEVSERLGMSTHSLYKWVKAIKLDKSDQQAAELLVAKTEILRLRAQLQCSGSMILDTLMSSKLLPDTEVFHHEQQKKFFHRIQARDCLSGA